jgi:hypothetical protein
MKCVDLGSAARPRNRQIARRSMLPTAISSIAVASEAASQAGRVIGRSTGMRWPVQ